MDVFQDANLVSLREEAACGGESGADILEAGTGHRYAAPRPHASLRHKNGHLSQALQARGGPSLAIAKRSHTHSVSTLFYRSNSMTFPLTQTSRFKLIFFTMIACIRDRPAIILRYTSSLPAAHILASRTLGLKFLSLCTRPPMILCFTDSSRPSTPCRYGPTMPCILPSSTDRGL